MIRKTTQDLGKHICKLETYSWYRTHIVKDNRKTSTCRNLPQSSDTKQCAASITHNETLHLQPPTSGSAQTIFEAPQAQIAVPHIYITQKFCPFVARFSDDTVSSIHFLKIHCFCSCNIDLWIPEWSAIDTLYILLCLKSFQPLCLCHRQTLCS